MQWCSWHRAIPQDSSHPLWGMSCIRIQASAKSWVQLIPLHIIPGFKQNCSFAANRNTDLDPKEKTAPSIHTVASKLTRFWKALAKFNKYNLQAVYRLLSIIYRLFSRRCKATQSCAHSGQLQWMLHLATSVSPGATHSPVQHWCGCGASDSSQHR